MKILIPATFPTHVLPGLEHGGESGHHATWLPPLAAALEAHAHKHDIHWVTFTKETSEAQTVSLYGQTFHLLPRGSLAIQILTSFRRERAAICKVVNALNPDLVHVWGTEQGYAMAAADCEWPWLLSMQGILQSICERASQHPLLRWQSRSEKRVLAKARHITVESTWAEQETRRFAPVARIDHLAYGVSAEWFHVDRKPDATPLALFVGTLSESKGVDTLLDAFHDPRLSHMKLVMLGDGPLRRDSNERMQFLGYVNPHEVRQWMQRAWLLVHPTRADACPNSVKEARVMGLPVVTTTEGGQVDWVVQGKSGILHAPGDREALIRGVLELTEALEKNRDAGEFDRERCRGMADATQVAERLVAIWQEAAGLVGP